MHTSTIVICIREHQLKAEIFDTPTGSAILNILPFETRIITWGDEFYFRVDATAPLEAPAREVVEIGALAYWPTMPAFCVFFGPTPVSHRDEPRAAGPVNVFGKLVDPDVDLLRSFRDGEKVTVLPVG